MARVLSVVALAVLLAGCTAPAATPGAPPAPLPDDATVGSWKPLVLAGVDAVEVPPPPADAAADLAGLRAAVAALDANGTEAALFWDEGAATERWTELQIRMITTYKQSPPRAARALALVHAAMYDATIVTWDAKYEHERAGPAGPGLLAKRPGPSYPSEHAAVAAAAARVLGALYPQQGADWFERQAEEAALSRVAGGATWPSDVEAGLAIGRAVGDAVLAHAAMDGADAETTWEAPVGPCHWKPTPPLFIQTPLEPGWGAVRPMVMPNGSAHRLPPPPDCDGEDGREQMMEVYRVATAANERQLAIGAYWADGPDATGPPAHWNRILLDLAERHELTTPQAARAFAYMNAALFDAGIGVWDSKYAHWSIRPVTWIHERGVDPAFRTQVVTPPFPSYPSGHSGFSAAAARTLQHFFPEDAVYLRALATEAANARIYSGIHTRADDEDGLWLGYEIANDVVARAKSDGGWSGTLDRERAIALTSPPPSTRWAPVTEGSLSEGGYPGP